MSDYSPIFLNFAQGLDTITDPKQVQVGKFLSLENTIFDTAGLMQKRNGFGLLPSTTPNISNYLTTLNGGLTTVGNQISAYSESTNQWVNKGTITPMQVSALSLIRNTITQTQVDAAIAPNGLVCTVYTETPDGNTFDYKYAIADSTTGQNIVEPTLIPAGAGTIKLSPRVFVVGTVFVIVFTNQISGAYRIQYIAIPTGNPTTAPTTAQDITVSKLYTPPSGATPKNPGPQAWDAFVLPAQPNQPTSLYIAWNSTTSSQNVTIAVLSVYNAAAGLQPSTTQTLAGVAASILTFTADTTGGSPLLYLITWDGELEPAYFGVFNASLYTIVTPTPILLDLAIANLTAVAQNGTCSVFAEISDNYTYDPSIPTNYIERIDITPLDSTFTSVFSHTTDGATSVFAVSSANATAGAIYYDTAKGALAGLYAVAITISGGTTLTTVHEFGVPSTSGTLTKLSGTGDATITFSAAITTGTHTITASSATGLVSGQYLVDNTTPSNILAGTQISVSGTTLSLYYGDTSVPAYTLGSSASSPGDSLTVVTIDTPEISIGSVGLASKAFIVDGTIYYLAAYQSDFQPSYFLINGSLSTSAAPNIVAQLANSSGGGYLVAGLPDVSVNNNIVQIPYQIKDSIASVNKGSYSGIGNNVTWIPSTGNVQTAGIYSNTGLNLASFNFTSEGICSSEIANCLYISGGYLTLYDGYLPVEDNFFVYPDNVEAVVTANLSGGLKSQEYFYQATYEWTDNQGNPHYSSPSIPVSVTIPANNIGTTFNIFTQSATSFATVGVSSLTDLSIGQYISDTANPTYIPDNTQITSVNPGFGFQSVFSSGATTITVSADVAALLTPGQALLDTTTNSNLSAHTVVTLVSGTTIYLSNSTTGNSAGGPGDTIAAGPWIGISNKLTTNTAVAVNYGGGAPGGDAAAIVGLQYTSVFYNGQSSIVLSGVGGLFVGQTITDFSNPTGFLQANTTITSINTSTNTIGLSLPTIANSTTSGGDVLQVVDTGTITVNIPYLRLTNKTANPPKLVLYRWSTSQQAYYQVTSLTAPIVNDTTNNSYAYVDKANDATILGNNLIYTSGGVIEDNSIPATNITTLFDTRMWAVDAEDQNKLFFSKPVIENTPVEWNTQIFNMYIAPNIGTEGPVGPITALAPMDDKLIIFKQNGLYYINGVGPDATDANNGYSQPIFITSSVGCINQQSILLMKDGLMFQSNKGIWLLPRGSNECVWIGAPVKQYNDSVVESAVSVPGTNQLRFTLDTGEHLMYDYFFQQWSTFNGIPAVSSCVYKGLHTLLGPPVTINGNLTQQIFQETPGLYLDGTNPVLQSWLTSYIKTSSIQGFQRIREFQLVGEYISPHILNVQVGYNFGNLSQQESISPVQYPNTWGSDGAWGQSTPWGGTPNLEQWRILTNEQKCQVFQIGFQEVFDPSFSTVAGAGLTLSGINCVVQAKAGYRPFKSANSVG